MEWSNDTALLQSYNTMTAQFGDFLSSLEIFFTAPVPETNTMTLYLPRGIP